MQTWTPTPTLTSTPTQTSTPTPTPTVLVSVSSCSPRPRVVIEVTPAGPGERRVTVTTTSNPSFGANALQQIRFEELQLVEVDVLGERNGAVPLIMNYPAGTTQASFILRRTTAGALMARFTVTDSCGGWPTFVGAGPSSGW
jgi:hypothetical protein